MVKLVPVDPIVVHPGTTAGTFEAPGAFGEADDEIARLFYGSDP